jgi:proline iminopeptidase
MTSDTEGMKCVPGGRVRYRIAGEIAPGILLLIVHSGPGASCDYLESL